MSVYEFDLWLPDVKEFDGKTREMIHDETDGEGSFYQTDRGHFIVSFSREAKSRTDAVALAIHQVAKAGYLSFLEDVKPIKDSE